MAKYQITDPVSELRARRLKLFCREVKRALFGCCLDSNFPVGELDFFVEDLFRSMERNENEYTLVYLLEMLLDDAFLEAAFSRYRASL